MRPAQLQAREVLAAIRRRWKLIVIPVVLITTFSAIAIHLQVPKYESSTTIILQPDRILNPMSSFEMAVAFEEQMRNFYEILYSRTVLQALADSLGLTANAKTEPERLGIALGLTKNFYSTRLGSNSFRITYIDVDPRRAQRGAQVLANLFIETKISFTERQNALTVRFYEKKVQESREAFENTVRSWVSEIRQDSDDLPLETKSLYNQLDEAHRNISTTTARLNMFRHSFETLKNLPEQLQSDRGLVEMESVRQTLMNLQGEDLPYSAELKSLHAQYEVASHRYTARYPEVEKLEDQLLDVLRRMRNGVELEIPRLEGKQRELEERRAGIIEELKRVSANTKINKDRESNYEMVRKQYNDMLLKLDQAKLAQEIAGRGADQFVMIDPAFLPTQPSKPKYILLAAGAGLGLLLGLLAAVVAEFLDTTVRSPRDVEIYQKPIIALLPEAGEK
jgi:succinoglycan biosynthesis transport protein ExoP